MSGIGGFATGTQLSPDVNQKYSLWYADTSIYSHTEDSQRLSAVRARSHTRLACGYVPKTLRGSVQDSQTGIYMYVPETLRFNRTRFVRKRVVYVPIR